jgi:hypothetical protein
MGRAGAEGGGQGQDQQGAAARERRLHERQGAEAELRERSALQTHLDGSAEQGQRQQRPE